MHLHEDRAGAFKPGEDRAAGDVAAPFGQEQGGGIGDLGQAQIGHLENADLVGGAVAVLHGAQDAELMAAVAFEIQDRVDHVFQHAGAGKGAVLGHVADQHKREIAGFCQPDQFETAGAHLGDGAGGAFDGVDPHRLDRVDDHQRRVGGFFQGGGDVPDIDGGCQFDRGVGDAEAAGAQADLIDRLFAGDVKHPAAGTGEAGRGLQQQGRFADAGVAADQDDRGWDEAAAENAVQFGDADGGAGRGFGAASEADERDRPSGRGFRGGAGACHDCLFLDGVPLAACLAPSGPFQGDGATRLADESGGGFSHAGFGEA